MSANNPEYSNQPGSKKYKVGITGTGASDPVKRYGNRITVTRTATGVYRFSFADHPGVFLDFKHGLRAATPGDVKGHTVTAGTYVAASGSTNGYIELSLWNSSFAADDLQLLEYLGVEFEFSEVSLATVSA